MKKQQKHSARASINPACICLITVLTYLINTALSAAIITVNTLDNESNSDDDCSLREAIRSANENISFDACTDGDVGMDTIFVGVGGTINVSSALSVTESLELLGPGRDALTISGQNSSGIFIVNLGSDQQDFEMSGVTIADGSESVPGAGVWIQRGGTFTFSTVRFRNNRVNSATQSGGAIAVELPAGDADTSTLIVRRSIFEDNSSGFRGGAIYAVGGPNFRPLASIAIEESVFTGNQSASEGGALYSSSVSTLSVVESVFRDNLTTGEGSSSASGGAIWWRVSQADSSAFVLIRSSTFSGNESDSAGGAIDLLNGTALLENNTFFGNQASAGFGEALSARGNATVALFFNTLLENNFPNQALSGAIYADGDDTEISLAHTIVWSANGAPDPECRTRTGSTASITSLGFNIDASGACATEPSDFPMTDPMLSPLGDYGDGTTWAEIQTAHPLVTSPAIDGGSAGPCTGGFGATIATDQRGETRPVDGDGNGSAKCDIGAVEVQPGSEPASFVLTASVAGDGTIISDPRGIECLLDCDQPYLAGTSVTLSIIPQPGFQFESWNGDCSGSGECMVTMNGDRSVGATFEPATLTYQVDVELDGNGVGMVASMPPGIDCPSDCSEDFENNTSVVLMPFPDSASSFFGWRADCASAGAGDCQFNVDQPARAIAIFSDGDLLFLDGFE